MARMHKVHIRRSPKNKQFYVTIKAPNGEPVFDGCEGYQRKGALEKTLNKLVAAFASGTFKVVDESGDMPVKKLEKRVLLVKTLKPKAKTKAKSMGEQLPLPL